jgi:glucans biosynthesis protein C
MNMNTASRRYDLDWLRVFASYLLVLFHVAMVFNPAPFYHIRNADLSFVMLVFCSFVSLWHMPLFFVLAGWSIFASQQNRTVQKFLKERISRLFIPLLTSCIIFAPLIKYVELKSGIDLNHARLLVSAELQESFKSVIPSGLPVMPPFRESFFEFLPTFFTQLDRFTWSHLWFLAYLLTFTLLYLPLFLKSIESRDSQTVSYLESTTESTTEPPRQISAIWAYMPLVPLIIIQLTLRERFVGIYNLYNDWANFAYYSTFLITGFLLARYPRFEQAVDREWKRALAIAIASTLLLLLSVLGIVTSPPVIMVSVGIAAWCFIVFLLGIARSYLTTATPTLGYLSRSAFPVYVLHQPAIVLIGYWLIQLPMGVMPKFLLLLFVALSTTLAIYHLIVRPIPILCFLLGVKSSSKKSDRYTSLP